ncbi:MAG: redoxin domain-containing protein, partial [Chloroflexi bacterium]|nr:redoxin domain-containing protein [Chloroflexota bacterium]
MLAKDVYGTVRAPEFPPGAEWINTPRPLSLAALRGRLVLLDFWTYGCINCMHIIPDLQRLEDEFGDALVVIGVHSAKFANERYAENVRRVIERYGVRHPVVNDPEFTIWEAYAVRAWPTTVLIDPRGRVIGTHSGEGVYRVFRDLIAEALERYEADGILDRTPLDEVMPAPASPAGGILRFPGKVLADESGGRLFIADTGHHRIVVATLGGEVVDVIGSGQRG